MDPDFAWARNMLAYTGPTSLVMSVISVVEGLFSAQSARDIHISDAKHKEIRLHEALNCAHSLNDSDFTHTAS